MPSEHTKRVAKIFEEARRKQGLTQSEVAEKAGLHPNSYAKIERAESEPSTESLRKLIKALKIDPSRVL
jgi:transcriptional regulator with XRE-family HTH domain